jgi:Arc/MetJ family transcription regulator
VIHWIESDTLLRTEDDLLAETMRTLGFKRRGPNITATLHRAITQARQPRE